MTFLQPWGLLGLSALPLIVAIHLFQRRSRRQEVPAVFLWSRALISTPAGRRIRPPRATLSLLLELSACLFITLLLAGASCTRERLLRKVAFVLDGSASMQAKPPGGPSFKDRAIKRLFAELRRVRPDRITVVVSGDPPRILLGPEANPDLLPQALQGWDPSGHSANVEPALALAGEFSDREVVFLTDHLPEGDPPPGSRWIAVGEPLGNRAFLNARRTPFGEKRDLVRLTVADYGLGGEFTLTVHALKTPLSAGKKAGRIVFERTYKKTGTMTISFTVPSSAPLLVAELPSDPLPVDNRVYLPPFPRRKVRCLNLLRGEGGAALRRALLSIPKARIEKSPPCDLVFLPFAEAAEAPRGAWIVAFPPFGRDDKDVLFAGPYTVDATDPLLVGVSVEGVLWSAVQNPPFKVSVPIISAGEVPLLYKAPPPHLGYFFNCDLAQGNLARTAAFPVLIHNIVEARAAELPGPDSQVVQAGEVVRLRLEDRRAEKLHLVGPGWSRSMPYDTEVFVTLPQRALPIQVKAGRELLFTLGCNWHDPEESDLRPLNSGVRTRTGRKTAPGAFTAFERYMREDPLFWILLLLSASALAANWLLLRGEGGHDAA